MIKSILALSNKTHTTPSLNDLISILEVNPNAAVIERIKTEYTNSKTKSSVRAFLKTKLDQFIRQNSQIQEKISFNRPDRFIEVINMLNDIKEFGLDKEHILLKEINERISNGSPISRGQLSLVSAIWLSCQERKNVQPTNFFDNLKKAG